MTRYRIKRMLDGRLLGGRLYLAWNAPDGRIIASYPRPFWRNLRKARQAILEERDVIGGEE